MKTFMVLAFLLSMTTYVTLTTDTDSPIIDSSAGASTIAHTNQTIDGTASSSTISLIPDTIGGTTRLSTSGDGSIFDYFFGDDDDEHEDDDDHEHDEDDEDDEWEVEDDD